MPKYGRYTDAAVAFSLDVPVGASKVQVQVLSAVHHGVKHHLLWAPSSFGAPYAAMDSFDKLRCAIVLARGNHTRPQTWFVCCASAPPPACSAPPPACSAQRPTFAFASSWGTSLLPTRMATTQHGNFRCPYSGGGQEPCS